MYPEGSDYLGKVSVTETGLECQRWDSQTHYRDMYNDSNFPEKDLTLASNYCRNPLLLTRPWCFITETEWEFCNLERCHTGTDVTDDVTQVLM